MFNDRDLGILGGGALLAVLCLFLPFSFAGKMVVGFLVLVAFMALALLRLGPDRVPPEVWLMRRFRYSGWRPQVCQPESAHPEACVLDKRRENAASRSSDSHPFRNSSPVDLAWNEVGVYPLLTALLGVVGVYFAVWLRVAARTRSPFGLRRREAWITLISLIAALALAAIPILLGWRRTVDEAGMARAMGIAQPKKRFDPEKFARQTGTGLAFNQIAYGFLAWVGGGLAGGIFLGVFPAILFAIAGGLLYAGTLSDKRQEFRLKQAKDILRGLGVVETLLSQGKPLGDALDDAAQAVGPDGRMVLGDLVVRLRTAPADEAALAVREWTTAWDNPAVDIVATSLLASIEGRIEIGPLVASLRKTLGTVVEVLSRARAAAKGVEWQARFLALFPPCGAGGDRHHHTGNREVVFRQSTFVTPVIIGSGVSYWLSMRMIRNGLSIEASMGLQAGGQGEIRLDRLGRVL